MRSADLQRDARLGRNISEEGRFFPAFSEATLANFPEVPNAATIKQAEGR